MIRVKVILCKLNSLNLSDNALFNRYYSNFKPSQYVCPHCECRGIFSYHSDYSRSMISFINGDRCESTVSVPRVICQCGHTHALIPDHLIPYGSYSLRFILVILQLFMSRHCNVAAFCDKWQISISTIYYWKHLFTLHYNLWFSVLNEISELNSKAFKALWATPMLPSAFFCSFRFSFLQSRYKTTKSTQDRSMTKIT